MPFLGRKNPGELEAVVLETLWASKEKLSVREVLARIKRRPALAYTTILTVLDRLHDKRVVEREKNGKAFRYWPRLSKEQWLGEQAAEVLTRSSAGAADGGVLMAFLDAAERVDPELLHRLSALIADRRKRGRP